MLDDDNAFDLNLGMKERGIAEEKLNEFITEFLKCLADHYRQNSTLQVFCRVDVLVFIDQDKKVSFFVNEVERGMTTSLFSSAGPSVVGQVGLDILWPLASWISKEKIQLGIN